MTLTVRLALGAVVLAVATVIGVAAAPPGTKPATAPAAKPAPAAASTAAASRSPDALMKTILGAEEAVEKSGLKYPESLRWLVDTIVGAADQVAAHPQATAAQKQEASEYKIGVLIQAAQYKPDEFVEPCRKYCAELAKTQPGTVAGALGATFPFVLDVMNADKLPADAADRLVKLAKAHPTSPILPQVFAQLADQYKEAGDAATAVKLLEEGVAVFKSIDDRDAIETVSAGLTRLKLIGSEVDFSGPTLAGANFDMKSLRGKVVLVDFWATWCGPCVAELPHVKAAYEKFHDQGFEVVGISLDDDREELASFVKENATPWPQIIFAQESERGWESPLVKKFSVKMLPTMFLVGPDGKLITDELRGDGVLEKAVEEALQSAAPPKTAAKPTGDR